MDKGRLDFAQVLISTTSLDILNTSFVILVDGCKVTIKLVEEWGCNLGEDAFLIEEGSIIHSQHNDDVSEHLHDVGFEDDQRDVQDLINDMQNG